MRRDSQTFPPNRSKQALIQRRIHMRFLEQGKAMAEVADAEGGQFVVTHPDEVEVAFASGEAVAKFARRGEGG